MTDFVWVGSLSKVALFFLSGIRKMNWSGITHSDSQKPGFLKYCLKKPGFSSPVRARTNFLAEFWDFDSKIAADIVKFIHTHLLIVVKFLNFC